MNKHNLDIKIGAVLCKTTETKCQCTSCGYLWVKGQPGNHSCSVILQRKLEAITEALKVLSVDMHQTSTRPCETCRSMTKLIGFNYGCYAYQERLKNRN